MNSHADVSERTFYGCVLCEYTATQKVNLRIHMETKHKVKLAGKDKTYSDEKFYKHFNTLSIYVCIFGPANSILYLSIIFCSKGS